jgi:hypothetical protein
MAQPETAPNVVDNVAPQSVGFAPILKWQKGLSDVDPSPGCRENDQALEMRFERRQALQKEQWLIPGIS